MATHVRDKAEELCKLLFEGDPELGGENYSRQTIVEYAAELYYLEEKEEEYIVDVIRNMAQLRLDRRTEIRAPLRDVVGYMIDIINEGPLDLCEQYFPDLHHTPGYKLTVEKVVATLIKSEAERLEETEEARDKLTAEFLSEHSDLAPSPTFQAFVAKMAKNVVHRIYARNGVGRELLRFKELRALIAGREDERFFFASEDQDIPSKIAEELSRK